jgi:hypothetical protein
VISVTSEKLFSASRVSHSVINSIILARILGIDTRALNAGDCVHDVGPVTSHDINQQAVVTCICGPIFVPWSSSPTLLVLQKDYLTRNFAVQRSQ